MNYVGIGARLVFSATLAISAASVLSSHARAADMRARVPAQTTASDTASNVLWLGGDFKNNVSAAVVGGIHAFSGNLDAPGWLVRGQFTYVGFDFNTLQSATGTAHGDFYRGDASIGYQVVGNGLVASGFVGLDLQRYVFNPAAADSGRLNDKVGALFTGRIATVNNAPFPFAIDGRYSTANNDFWVRLRPAMKFGVVTVGPEVTGLGNNTFDEARFGGYMGYDISRSMIMQANLGYADATRNNNSGRGGSGVYGGVTLVFLH